jgi:hypothetical protein
VRSLPEQASTELSSDLMGKCPIQMSGACFDRVFSVEATNTCDKAIRVNVEMGNDGGKGRYEASGEYRIDPGQRVFRCGEALSRCSGIRVTLLGFVSGEANPSPENPKTRKLAKASEEARQRAEEAKERAREALKKAAKERKRMS